MKASKKKISVRFLFTLIAACFVLFVFAGDAQIIQNDGGQGQYISIVVGQSHVVKAPWPTVRVAVTDPKIADVKILTPDQVLLQGLKVGATDLIMWNEDETRIWQVAVNVTLDVEGYQQKLNRLFPDCRIELDQSGSVLIANGLLRKADQAVKLHEFLEKTNTEFIDMTSVAGVQQVQLQVRVAEVSRTALRALGLNSLKTDQDYFFGINPLSSAGFGETSIGVPEGTLAGENLPFQFGSDVTSTTINVVAGFSKYDLELFLTALAENQYLRILANPTLIALSGEEASFLAGGEFPIPIPQTGTSDNITVEYKEFGVRLTFRPTVLGNGTIRLYVAPEVSELTSVGSVQLEQFEIPALTTRKAETTLELNSGQSFAMAGLLRSNVDAVKSRLPGLGDLPILGPLFSSIRYQKEETELVILVTANLVEPMSFAQMPPLPGFLHNEPNDWEFYIEGKIDNPEPPKVSPADAEWMKQMGLDRLIGPGAWDSYDSPAVPSRSDMEQSDTAYQKQVGYIDYQSDVVDEQFVSSGDENASEAYVYVTEVDE